MPPSATPTYRFTGLSDLPLEATFDGGRLTSDGGLPWLSEAEAALGICTAFAACVPEWRRGPVRHSWATLVRQRVCQIACGDEDPDDADALRTDPLFTYVCGRLPESGGDLASQPTLSRLETAVDRRACDRRAVAWGARSLRERERGGVPGRILIDLARTDDPTHGHQEGTADHGSDGQPMDHPLLLFAGTTDQLSTAVWRPGDVHASRGVVAVLKRVVRARRDRWPGVAIEGRIARGGAVPAISDVGERAAVGTTRADPAEALSDW